MDVYGDGESVGRGGEGVGDAKDLESKGTVSGELCAGGEFSSLCLGERGGIEMMESMMASMMADISGHFRDCVG